MWACLHFGTMSFSDYIPVFEGKLAVVSSLLTSVLFTVLSSRINVTYIIFIEFVCVLMFLSLWKYVQCSRVLFVAHLLGVVLATGIQLLQFDHINYLGMYMIVLAFFHLSEYIVTSIHNPTTLQLDSFLINHSLEYVIAAIASWIEYAIEYYYWPYMKSYFFVSWFGIVLIICGEMLRKLAMLTAMSNFTHHVQFYKRHNHQLVTSGVYRFFRHPSYVGWFYWSIGTQLLLCNPICAVAYMAASWMFFRERIICEEQNLVHFFGQDYINYQKEVGTGLPFISGYKSPINIH